MKSYFSFLLLLSILFVAACQSKYKHDRPDMDNLLLDADISYISQRVEVMVYPPGDGLPSGRTIFLDGMRCILQERISFLPSGKTYVRESGGSEGIITYREETFWMDLQNYKMELYPVDDYFIYHHYYGKDTIRDFVIMKDMQITMPVQDYEVFIKQAKLPAFKRQTEIFTFYRYK